MHHLLGKSPNFLASLSKEKFHAEKHRVVIKMVTIRLSYIPAGKMKLEFLESPSSTLLGCSRISNLIQAYLWDFLEIACWYWPYLAIIQATKFGLGGISLNLRQKCGFQENSSFSNSLKIEAQC